MPFSMFMRNGRVPCRGASFLEDLAQKACIFNAECAEDAEGPEKRALLNKSLQNPSLRDSATFAPLR